MKRKTILIVGGNSGIGAEVLDQFLQRDHAVHLALRNPEEITQPVASKQFYDALQGGENELEFPDHLDAIVYCPGTIALKPFHRTDSEQMSRDMEVNAFGAARIIQAALPMLKKSTSDGGASVIMFSSVAAQTGLAFHASIGMAKAAVEGLTLSLASELAPAGVRVNAIAPSLTDTPLAEMLKRTEIPRFWIDRLIDGRARDLDPQPFDNVQAARDYTRQTSGQLMQIAVKVLGGEPNDDVMLAGEAWGLTGLARSYGYYHDRILQNLKFTDLVEVDKKIEVFKK